MPADRTLLLLSHPHPTPSPPFLPSECSLPLSPRWATAERISLDVSGGCKLLAALASAMRAGAFSRAQRVEAVTMMAGWVDGGGCWPVVLAALTPDDAHAAAASRAAARDAWAAVLVSFLP